MYTNPRMNLSDGDLELLEKFIDENRKIHSEILKMMIDIRSAFEKSNVQILLTGGTLLGSYLYKGFIPWDDDADMAINYKDYDKLLNSVKNNLPNKYELLTMDTHKKYLYSFPKIINKEIRLKTSEFGERSEFSYLWVDITMFKPSDKKKNPFAIKFWGKVLWVKNAKINWFVDSLMWLVTPFTQKFISKKIKGVMDKQKPGNYSVEPFPYRKFTKPLVNFESTTKVSFNNEKFEAIKNYEEWLVSEYSTWGGSIYNIPKKLVNHSIEIGEKNENSNNNK